MKMIRFAAATLSVIILSTSSACATAFSSRRPELQVRASADSALLISQSGDTIGRVPRSYHLPASRQQIFRVTAPSFDTADVKVGRRLKRLAYLNLINPVGWLIDLLTGAAWEHNPRVLSVSLDSLPIPELLLPDSLEDPLVAATLLALADLADSLGCHNSVGMSWRADRDLYLGVDGRTISLDEQARELIRSRVAAARPELRAICEQSNPALDSLRAAGSIDTAARALGMAAPVYFAFASAELPDSVRPRLRVLGAFLSRVDLPIILLIEGATDPIGDEASNFRLGCARARAVAEELLQTGVRSGRLRVLSRGENERWLVVRGAGGNTIGAYRNRRVSFALDFATSLDLNATEVDSCENE